MESEHDQLVRLRERVKIFKEWINSQYYYSEVDEYAVWEDIKNDTIERVEEKFDSIIFAPILNNPKEGKQE